MDEFEATAMLLELVRSPHEEPAPPSIDPPAFRVPGKAAEKLSWAICVTCLHGIRPGHEVYRGSDIDSAGDRHPLHAECLLIEVVERRDCAA